MNTAKHKSITIHKVDLKKLCKNSGLTMRRLSEIAEIDETTISKYSNGYRVMSEDTWNKIKNILISI